MPILSIDQGTSSTRSIIFDKNIQILGSNQLEHRQIFPHKDWVEHDPLEIIENVKKTIYGALSEAKLTFNDIECIGITNQRETIVAWDTTSKLPLYNAIVWQCRRSSGQVEQLKKDGYEELFMQKTGLVLDAYFSGTKINWLKNNVHKIKEAGEKAKLAFGTIDSWIIYNLTGSYTTDASNASRTLLFNTHTVSWDEELSEVLDVNIQSLPEVIVNASDRPFGIWKIDGSSIPIRGVLGDQQAALFGQNCIQPGSVKTTYGTGNFSLLNTGKERKISSSGLLSTVAWQLENSMTYALEGSVFITGAAFLWLRDQLGIIQDFSQIDTIAELEQDNSGLIFVPAFVGLGAPYWDSSARGTILGLTRGTNKSHILHATIDAVAFQTEELIEILRKDSGLKIDRMRVDGGLSQSDLIMQKQANISQIAIERPLNIETTALGAALMAGYRLIWDRIDEFDQINPINHIYHPKIDGEERDSQKELWNRGVERARNWL